MGIFWLYPAVAHFCSLCTEAGLMNRVLENSPIGKFTIYYYDNYHGKNKPLRGQDYQQHPDPLPNPTITSQPLNRSECNNLYDSMARMSV